MTVVVRTGTVAANAPNLPISGSTYNVAFQNQFNNALRIYFNQLDSNTQQFIVGIASVGTLQWLGND